MAVPAKEANPKLTALAKRYGQAKSPLLLGTGKSGLTPVFLQPLFGSRYSEARDKFDDAVRKYQRDHLAFYTVKELQDLGAIDNPDAKLGDLQNPVHQLYNRTLWRDANIPLGHGLAGTWSVNNPRVWEVLVPCLRLASMFLNNIHVWPWFDALLFSPRDRIDTDEDNEPPEPPDDSNGHSHLHEFGYRMAKIVAGSRDDKEAKEMFDFTARHVQLWNFLEDPRHSDKRGLTEWNSSLEAISIGIHWKVIDPLLRDDLSVSERLVQQFKTAVALLHETAHALEIAKLFQQRQDNPDSDWSIWEPFLEDEDFAELGYSMENAVFGGTVSGLVGPPSIPSSTRARETVPEDWIPPEMGIVIESLPNHRIIDHYLDAQADGIAEAGWMIRNVHKYVDEPANSRYSTFEAWPLTIAMIQNLHTTEYWRCIVAACGVDAFRSPRILGQRIGRHGVQHIYGPEFSQSQNDTTAEEDEAADFEGSLPAVQKWKLSNQQFTRSRVLHFMLSRQDADVRVLEADQRVLDLWDLKPPVAPFKGEGFVAWQERAMQAAKEQERMEQLRESVNERRKLLFGLVTGDIDDLKEAIDIAAKQASESTPTPAMLTTQAQEMTSAVETIQGRPHMKSVQLSSLLDAHFRTPPRTPSRSTSPPKSKYDHAIAVDPLRPSVFKTQPKKRVRWVTSDSEREEDQTGLWKKLKR
ncbi:hypothetical protein PVAG01_10905 [Phlyctema vagabunda]|uniref:Uncharacterized protein n=1 Tax=Phlyctema vagabunda TaxID=108571 RepID=A0ABR4P3K9_9HELO